MSRILRYSRSVRSVLFRLGDIIRRRSAPQFAMHKWISMKDMMWIINEHRCRETESSFFRIMSGLDLGLRPFEDRLTEG